MNKQQGFTIIELIVVIAIIAVLAAIVLVNVTQYINKGKNAAIEGNMATLLTNSAVYFDNNPTKFGSDFVADTAMGCGSSYGTGGAIYTAISNDGGTLTCFGDYSSQNWCGVTPTLAAGSATASYFCIDSTGYKGAMHNCSSYNYTCQ